VKVGVLLLLFLTPSLFLTTLPKIKTKHAGVNKLIKKISIIASVFSAFTLTTAFAADGLNARSGFYVGGALSFYYISMPEDAALHSDLDMDGFFGVGNATLVPVLGYRFNDYFALEASYDDFGDSSEAPKDGWGADHYSLWTAGLAGKLFYPFKNSKWSIYGKGGLALTHQDVYNQEFVGQDPIVDSNTRRIQPLAGVGLTYNFIQSTAIDIGYTHQFQSGITPAIGTFAFGLTYTF
jgi:opacity protein-like surface antigen